MPVSLPRNAQVWLPGYIRSRLRNRLKPSVNSGPTHILFSIVDHFEPDHGKVTKVQEQLRVARWRAEYPALARQFKDADGRPPQHSFFYPAEMYCAEHLDALADICRSGFGEVEVHLHHGHDTSANLRHRLETYVFSNL